MPELPEVETVKRVLSPIVINHKINRIDILRSSIVENKSEQFVSFFENETFLNISRIGKFLIFHLTNDKVLISHLRMEGKYIELDEKEDNTKYARVVFHLDNGHKLCYDDSRSFGRMIMSNEDSFLKEKEIVKLGPEPFDVKDVKPLLDKCGKMNLPIKTALLSQEIITGLGNIYVDEVLFASHIHPLTPAKLIKKNEWEDIISNSVRILNKAIELGGSTIRSYHPGKDIDGNFQTNLLAYGRSGEECAICHTFMRFIKVNGRGTTYCPHCQIKLGAPLKVAIVGKIGAGKSLVLDILKNNKFSVYSSDEIVHELYKKEDLEKLIRRRLNIKVENDFVSDLREHLKVKTSDLDKLEKIVHPQVRNYLEEQFKKDKCPLLAAEVPLLFKAHMENMFDVIIGIDVNEKIQLERIAKRDQEKSAFLKRINDENNLFDEHRNDLDFIIFNNKDYDSLVKEVQKVINKVLSRLDQSLSCTSI